MTSELDQKLTRRSWQKRGVTVYTNERIFLCVPGRILLEHTTYCSSHRSKRIQVSVASFSLYLCLIATRYEVRY